MQKVNSHHRMQIERIAGQKVWIQEQALNLPILITLDKAYQHSLPNTLDALNSKHLDPLLEDSIDLLLIGTGIEAQALAEPMLAWCYRHRIGVETMNSEAACRAFQMLAADQRALALLLFGQEES